MWTKGYPTVTSVMFLNVFKLLLLCLLFFIHGIESNSTPNVIPCPDGWYLFEEKCYKVFGQNYTHTWIEARDFCIQQNGHLATIHSKELQDFINTFLLLSARSNLYIGLNDRAVKRDFQWDDGSELNYTNWMSQEPNSPQENCVEIRFWPSNEMGKWNDEVCTDKQPFICQTNKSEEVHSSDPRFCSRGRGGGWKHLNSCFHYVEDKKSWDDAEKTCQDNYNGHLVTIGEPITEKFLNDIFADISNLYFWIGIKTGEGTPKWSSGLNLVFNRWIHGEQPMKGYCGLRTSRLSWINVSCLHRHSFICETSSSTLPAPVKVPENRRCPSESSEWIDFDGDTCYIFETKRFANWNEAKYACMVKGGGLATILSEEESLAIQLHIIHNEKLFIGLHRSYVNTSDMEWIDGTEMKYQKWLAGQPDNFMGGENCGEVLTATMEWNDVKCSYRKGYICSAKKVSTNLSVPTSITSKNESSFNKSFNNEECECRLPTDITRENQRSFNNTLSGKKCECRVPSNITRENQRSFSNSLSGKKCECRGDATFEIVMITMVCTIAISALIGVGIYLFKTRRIQTLSFVRFVS